MGALKMKKIFIFFLSGIAGGVLAILIGPFLLGPAGGGGPVAGGAGIIIVLLLLGGGFIGGIVLILIFYALQKNN
jgi:hypothetical protein